MTSRGARRTRRPRRPARGGDCRIRSSKRRRPDEHRCGSREPSSSPVVAAISVPGSSRTLERTASASASSTSRSETRSATFRASSAPPNCSAIVHLAAIPHDDAGTPEAIMATNVLGTWHVLLAAKSRRRRASRSTSRAPWPSASSSPGRCPRRLPIDDDYEASPVSPYSLSKRLGEILCATTRADGGPLTVCFRSTRIVGPDERSPRRCRGRGTGRGPRSDL